MLVSLRRNHDFRLSFLGLLFCSATWLGLPSSKVAAEKPNIIMICIDDLNANVGYMSESTIGPTANTPMMDLLAKAGTRYTDAHCSATVCVASRTSLLWGVQPSTTGITTGWIQALTQYRSFRQTTSLKNLVEILSENGYRTMGAGKVFHEHDANDWDQSFEQKHLDTDFFAYGASDPDVIQPDRNISTWAAARLAEQHEQPFFLAVGFHLPHIPLLVPQHYLDKHPIGSVAVQPVDEGDLGDVGPIAIAQANRPIILGTPLYDVTSEESLRAQTQAYLACVRHTDNQLRRVMAAMLFSRYRENTIVVLWSDHGYHLGAKRHIGKATLWRESTHVPLIIWAPAHIPRGTVTAPVSLLDVAPTILQIAGINRPAHFAGESLVGYTGERSEDVLTFYGDSISRVTSEQRMTQHFDDDGNLQEEEVYDRINDPRELTNLANQN